MAARLLSKVNTNVASLLSEKHKEQFDACKTDEERFKMTYDHMSLFKALPPREIHAAYQGSPKSASKSAELRKEGNKLISLQSEAAIECYNRSIMAAPYPASDEDDSTELAFAFGNRSLAYFKQEKYQVALKDIELAFKFKYPDDVKGKLLRRRADCYTKMNKLHEAAASSQEADKFAETGKTTKTTTEAENLKPWMPTPEDTGCVPEQPAEKSLVEKTYGQHKNIPAASDCLEIKYSPEFGRHLVATRDIRPGDILAIERPYASVLLAARYCTHCYNCLKRTDGMIPCQLCALVGKEETTRYFSEVIGSGYSTAWSVQVMYCSEACRDVSWRSYHRLECPTSLLSYVNAIAGGQEILNIAVRTWLVAYGQCGGLAGLRSTVRCLGGEGDLGQAGQSDYTGVLVLASHMDHVTPAFFNAAVAIVDRMEACTPLLGPEGGGESARVFAGALLVRHMRIAAYNSFRVDEAYAGFGKGVVGGGIYNLLSLCNHACWPNASRFCCDGDTKVLFAQLPIKQGEQIFILYAGDFKKEPRAARRATCEGFLFRCRCVACVEDWPVYARLSADEPVLLCPGCRVRVQRRRGRGDVTLVCPRCNAAQRLEDGARRLGAVLRELSALSAENAGGGRDPESDVATRAAGILGELYARVQMPFLPTVDCQELISKSYYKNLGNYSDVYGSN